MAFISYEGKGWVSWGQGCAVGVVTSLGQILSKPRAEKVWVLKTATAARRPFLGQNTRTRCSGAFGEVGVFRIELFLQKCAGSVLVVFISPEMLDADVRWCAYYVRLRLCREGRGRYWWWHSQGSARLNTSNPTISRLLPIPTHAARC
jgi:hypothetical protein